MKMKIIVIFACMLLISVVFPVSGLMGNDKIGSDDIKFNEFSIKKEHVPTQIMINDTIDQNQTEHCGNGIAIYNETMYAQSFKPSLGLLSRVQLFLFRGGNPSDDIKITVSIKQSLFRMDLVYASVNGSQISEQGDWVEFNFSYISVIPGNTYYIVCKTSGGTKTDHFKWYFDINNPYEGGDTQFSENHGIDWYPLDDPHEFPEIDFCFITYGKKNSAPNKPIKPDGETLGGYGKSYSYRTISADADEDQLLYFWDWGDGETSGWIGPYNSGETCEESHKWMVKGSYLIKVKSKDKWGVESEWSDSLTIRMQKRKNVYPLLLDLLLSSENEFQLFNRNFFVIHSFSKIAAL
jgi:hypothetical protein